MLYFKLKYIQIMQLFIKKEKRTLVKNIIHVCGISLNGTLFIKLLFIVVKSLLLDIQIQQWVKDSR